MRHKAAAVYARTLLDVAGEKGVRDEILAEARALEEAFAGIPALARALELPALAADKKARLLAPIKDRASGLLKKFLRLLEIKNRFALLPPLCAEVLRLDEERRQIRRARVVSAAPLSAEQLQRLSAGLSSRAGGRAYLLENAVDAGLIAGFRVEEDDKITDASLRHKLNVLRLKLAA